MIIIVCADKQFGTMFNHRRQTSDAAVVSDIYHIIEHEKGDSRLYMNSYSYALFSWENKFTNRIIVDDMFLDRCGDSDFCFVEAQINEDIFEKAEKVILYRWNKIYPADCKIETFFLKTSYIINETSQFSGKSHDLITREIYIRKQK
ncbi:MAG: ribonuclease Z [Eubacteriales bacterium]|nr:ribonuclease Z [Eubacteriales bacterium]